MRRPKKARQRPPGIVVDVGGEAKFRARAHDPRQCVDHALGHDATLAVAPLWPGVGIKDEHTGKEGVWSRLDGGLGVAVPQAYVGEAFALESGEHRDNAIAKWLTADDANIRIGLRLLDEMLAGPESDLKPDFAGRRWKHMPSGQGLRRN
jgi:hypothetical protein